MTATLPQTLNVGLKEWATVCSAMGAGRQIVLLRKGGIYESAGEFEVEQKRFLFFPTYVHQKLEMLKEDAREGFSPQSAEPARVTIALAGEVTDILEVKGREQMDELDDMHVWAPPLIDMRFSYKPKNPLYLLLVRVYRLESAVTVENTPAYAGCKSWVPLDQTISTQGARAVLDDTEFQTRRQVIRARVDGVSTGF